MTDFRWAILGPGPIAHKFADAVTRMGGVTVSKIHGRDIHRASAFADQWCRDRAVPGAVDHPLHPCATTQLSDVLHAPDVDAVYIATPHAFHAEAIRACLVAGKPVLCEKPLVLNAATAGELIALAREKNTLLMEAVWTRFLPIYAEVRQWLQANAIGAVRAMQSSFCFNTPFNPTSRLFDPAQGGGALLDIGIYNLTITRWVMECVIGQCPEAESLHARAVLAPTGVDQRLAATVTFPSGVTSQFLCATDGDGENAFHIYGEHGTITIHAPFWGANRATLAVVGAEPLTLERP
ncbi:MAG: Gfo/Idh/MocA family oxidoreductase, partial [Betaproteobacteria bacterium]|nr:Gfo/Idh/MocA family oxidoreductase [Betaproteobacteria bacterium]